MDNARWERIQTLFHEAAARPESERQAFLAAACGGDEQLMAEVSAMLQADGRGASLLDRGLPEVAYRLVAASLEPAGLREFGPYRLKRMLGEGGMGVVWLAERQDTGNLVAIKFLPDAGLSPARRERFAREIQTLAKLKHPYIARLYDAGSLADGTPWFVMEYVEGERFAEYCRRQEAPVEARLRLFRRVCEAVQYAHGQAIIHRDLKPSNIMVEKDGTPRLLDFGIARELQDADVPADRTRAGLRFFSPDYAAPEWVRDGTMGLYTDVYSLGVILYEMLTGQLPGRDGDQPRKPSAIASNSGLSKTAWSDLDALCLKALHRDPQERYQSVEALIRDIDHYLNSEPLEARPESLSYRAGKFVNRNRPAVVAASLTLALILVLTVLFTAGLRRERNMARAEAARTRRIQRFMVNLLGAGDKEAAPSNDLRVVTLLDRGARAATVLNSDPESQAELYENLGRMYWKLGKFQRADELMRLSLEKMKAALGPENPRLADILIEMGLSRDDQAQFKDAEGLVEQALNLAKRHLPPDDPTAMKAKSALGLIWADSGSYERAISVLAPLVRDPPRGEEGKYILLDSLTPLAAAQQNTGHLETAISLNRRALALDRHLLGNTHPRVGFELGDIASAEANRGQYAEAEAMYREAIQIYTAWYGQNHPGTALFKSLLALVLVHSGKKYDEADSLLHEALPIEEQAYGKVHPYVALAYDILGTLALMRGDAAAAQGYGEHAVTIFKDRFGDANHQTATARVHLAQVFIKEKQYERAEPILREAVKALMARQPSGNLAVAAARALLGRVLLREKHYREAEEHLTAAYAILEKQPGTAYFKRFDETREDLAALYASQGKAEKATRLRAELAANQSPNVAAAGAK